jgi:hypothetical protein
MKELLTCKQGFQLTESSDIEHSADVHFELPDKSVIHAKREDAAEPFTRLQEYRKSSTFPIPLSYHGLGRAVADIFSEESSKYITSTILTGDHSLI